MKKILILSVLLIAQYSFSQDYNGTVIDKENNQSIPFASVWVIELNTGASCLANGTFSLPISLPNVVHLKVSAVGYSSATITVKKEKLSNFTIPLSPSHIELQEMEISTSTGILENYSVTSIESKTLAELTTISTTSLGQAIGNISGVYSNSTGNGISKPVIRGMSGMRVSTYLNGLKIENQQWGGDHGIGVDALGIEKVEVIKGASSLLYGSDALGGVIYLKEAEYTESNHLEASVNSQFESNSLGFTNGFSFKLAKKNIRFNLFGNQTSHADYQIPSENYVFNSRFNGQAIKAALGMNKNNWVGNIRYSFITNELGIPGHTHDSIPLQEDLFKETTSRKKTLPLQVNSTHYISAENKFFFENSELKFTLGYISNDLQEFEEKVTIPGIEMKLNTLSYNGMWNIKKIKNHSIIFGAQGNFQSNTNSPKAEEILLRNLSATSHGIFSLIHSKWNEFTQTQIGIRGDLNEFDIKKQVNETENITLNYQSLNYSAGISYTRKKHAFRVNISSGYRPPHPIESLANGVHHSSRRFEIGSLSLKPEYANQLDFSYEYSNEHVSFIVNPYFSVIRNYVYLAFTDSISNGYPVVNYRQNHLTYFYGGEATFHYHPHFLHNLHLESNFTYLFAKDENQNSISAIPQPKLMALITYDLKSVYKLIPQSLAIQNTYFGEQSRVIENEIPTVAYNLLDIGANWKIKSKKLEGSLKIGAKNIFNSDYINHLSELKPLGIQNPGRNFYVTLNLTINQKIKSNEKNN